MPTRHASHSLEDESRRKFAAMLPSHWTVMDVRPDYGLDLRVELFDESGRATGRCFYVQLKATASPAGSRTRHVDVGELHSKYWMALSDPVLLVKYFQPSGSFVLQWTHRFHPRFDPKKPTARSKRFRFSKRCAWRPSSPLRIENEVDFLGASQVAVSMSPIEVGVSGADGVPDGASKAFCSQLPRGLVRWTDTSDDRAGHHLYLEHDAVVVRSGCVMVSIGPRVARPKEDATVGTADTHGDYHDWRSDVADALIGVALSAAGSPGQGCRIIAGRPPLSRVGAAGLLNLVPLITALGRAGRFRSCARTPGPVVRPQGPGIGSGPGESPISA